MPLDPLPAVVDDVRGQAVDLDVRRRDLIAAADERARLAHARGHRPGSGEQILQPISQSAVGPVGFVVADRRGLGGQVDVHMVLEVLAHARQVVDDVDAQRAQLVGRSDAGKQKQPRRVDRATAEHDLPVGVGGHRLVLAQVLDADRLPFLHKDLGRSRMGGDGQVPASTRGPQIGSGSAFASRVSLSDIVVSDAILGRAVEVVVERQAGLLRRPDERLAQLVVLHLLGHVHRAVVAVEGIREPLVVLCPAEERQDVLVTPVLVTQFGPALVVEGVPADVDHRVDRRAAAERAPLRIPHPAVVELRLRHRLETPVHAGAGELGEPDRQVDQRRPVAPARLQQQDARAGLLGQPVRDHAARGSGTHHDVVESVRHAHQSLR